MEPGTKDTIETIEVYLVAQMGGYIVFASRRHAEARVREISRRHKTDVKVHKLLGGTFTIDVNFIDDELDRSCPSCEENETNYGGILERSLSKTSDDIPNATVASLPCSEIFVVACCDIVEGVFATPELAYARADRLLALNDPSDVQETTLLGGHIIVDQSFIDRKMVDEVSVTMKNAWATIDKAGKDIVTTAGSVKWNIEMLSSTEDKRLLAAALRNVFAMANKLTWDLEEMQPALDEIKKSAKIRVGSSRDNQARVQEVLSTKPTAAGQSSDSSEDTDDEPAKPLSALARSLLNSRGTYLKGQIVAILGYPAILGRANTAYLIEAYRGRVSRKLNRKVDFVVVGDRATSEQLERVDELDVSRIDEDDLMKMLDADSSAEDDGSDSSQGRPRKKRKSQSKSSS